MNIPILHVSGDSIKRGREQGEGARSQIQLALSHYRQLVPDLLHRPWQSALLEAQKYLQHAQEIYPAVLDEMRGIAEGADVAFEEVWTLNCFEALTDSQEHSPSCTTLAVRDDQTESGHVLLAHNEDWLSLDQDTLYLVHSKPKEGPDFLGLTYGPLLVNIGLNAEGIGVGIDSVYSTDVRVGVPRIIYSRTILGAKTMTDALRACMPKRRAAGYHFLLADANGSLFSVETSAMQHEIIDGERGWLVHTNHYLSPRLKGIEKERTYANSHVRFQRATRLLRDRLGCVTMDDLQQLLRDHANQPDSICAHPDPSLPLHDNYQTLASLIMDLSERLLWVAKGPPCQGEFHSYRL
jgi:isopenicillin-N N-acyltransferase-like protein